MHEVGLFSTQILRNAFSHPVIIAERSKQSLVEKKKLVQNVIFRLSSQYLTELKTLCSIKKVMDWLH